MTQSRHHVVILPYFCEEEVDRYLRIADRLREFPRPGVGVDFLLAASPRASQSERLADGFRDLGNVVHFACPTQIFGYPEGPTAMFWDCMDYVAANYSHSDGFSLWLESDMAPVKPDWLDRLSDEWYGEDETPVMMGCFVPEVFKQRFFRKPKLLLGSHINGGACYSTDFALKIPAAARDGVFDVAVYQYALEIGRAKETTQIAFSTHERIRRDLIHPGKVLVHGFMQEKDRFIEQCVSPLTSVEQKTAFFHPIQDTIETARRKVRVWFVRRGHRAMLENLFLAQRKHQSTPTASPQPETEASVTTVKRVA